MENDRVQNYNEHATFMADIAKEISFNCESTDKSERYINYFTTI